ncbi:MAG TPA: hypothetical protein VGL65_02570 [Gemmatimonadales bacterium]
MKKRGLLCHDGGSFTRTGRARQQNGADLFPPVDSLIGAGSSLIGVGWEMIETINIGIVAGTSLPVASSSLAVVNSSLFAAISSRCVEGAVRTGTGSFGTLQGSFLCAAG